MKDEYLSVVNWEKHQHYKKRTPPWIKLQRDLLNDYRFSCLQDASKLHLILVWLLASQMDNKIPADSEFIKRRINVSTDIDFKELIDNGFLEDASGMLAQCKQVAMPETEEETEAEEETERHTSSGEFIDWVTWWNDLADKYKLTKIKVLSQKRKTGLKARVKEIGDTSTFKTTIENAISGSSFLQGDNDRGWKCDFDFILQQSSFIRMVEGKYDTVKKLTKSEQRVEAFRKIKENRDEF